MLLYLILKNLTHKRVLATLRADFPILLLLPGFIAGQTVSFLCRGHVPIALSLLFIVVAVIFKQQKARGILIVSLAVGFISALPLIVKRSAANLNAETSYVVKVQAEPRFRRPGEVELSLDVLGVLNDDGSVSKNSAPKILCKAIHLPWRNLIEVKDGESFIIRAKFTPVKRSLNPFSYESTLTRHGYLATCRILYATSVLAQQRRVLGQIRESIEQKAVALLGEGEKSGLVLAMALGTRDMLSDRTEMAFKRTGLAHLLVLSGYQVTLVYHTLLFLIRALLLRIPKLILSLPRWLAPVLSLSLSLAFVALTGIDGSSLRAALAILFVVIARTVERKGGMFNCILVSFIMLSIIWPGVYFEPGTELTYAALVGICSGIRGEESSLRAGVLACFYGCLMTSLVTVLWFEQLSIVGFFVNPILAPCASFISCNLGFPALLAASIGVDSNGYMLNICAIILTYFKELVGWLAELSWCSFKLQGFFKVGVAFGLAYMAFFRIILKAREHLIERGVWVGE